MAQGTRVIRSSGSLAVWSAGAVLGALALLDLLLGDVRGFWHALAPVLLALWALGLVLAHPMVRYDARALVVVNPGVVHTIPWSQVTGLDRGLQVAVSTHDRTIAAWGTPPVPRRRPFRSEPPTDWVYAELTAAWESARSAAPAPGSVVRRLDLAALAPGAVLLVATVITFAV